MAVIEAPSIVQGSFLFLVSQSRIVGFLTFSNVLAHCGSRLSFIWMWLNLFFQFLPSPMIINVLDWQRQWKNDVHMAIRDLNDARRILTTSSRAYHYMAEALAQVPSYPYNFLALEAMHFFPKFGNSCKALHVRAF